MKRIILFLALIAVATAGTFYLIQQNHLIDAGDIRKLTKDSIPRIKSNQEKKEVLPLFDGGLFDFVGEKKEKITKHFGEPDRKDMSAYGYTWWVYTDGSSKYIQFGVNNDRVETIFVTGDDISVEPLQIGAPYDEINDTFEFQEEVVYKEGVSFYKFLLNDDILETSPLIKLTDDLFMQTYFDMFTNKLSAIRLLTGETLLKQRIYEMEYRGSLPDRLTFNDEEWKKIEQGMERQIFDLTNIYRHRFDVEPLTNDEQVQETAYLHSKDMEENHYFSHYTEDGDGLKERLEKENIYYMSAGENIAAKHTDGPAAIEGWMNSEGHREALLNEEYTHLGVGVYRFYYTQNFLFKP